MLGWTMGTFGIWQREDWFSYLFIYLKANICGEESIGQESACWRDEVEIPYFLLKSYA